jgi:uncharacterized protein HemX
MGFLLLALLLILGAIAFNWLSKYCDRLAGELSQKEAQEKFYKDRLLEAAQNIERAVTPVEEKVDPVECLLAANREIIEKQRVKDAIESELGIEMRSQNIS